MRAAVYKGRGAVEVVDIPVPELGRDDVLVEVSHCGVCGTDLHFVIEGWGRPDSVGGHEWSGRVAALGAGVSGWSVGEAVTAPPPAFGTAGWQGAFAEYTRVAASELRRVPDGVDLRAAALTEPLAVALHAITRSGGSGRRQATARAARTLVAGAGPIGLLVVAALRARGVESVTVSEPGELRRRRALEVGAATAVRPDELAPAPAMPMDVVDEPFDVVIECSGRAAAMESGLGLLAPHGTLVLCGTGMQQPRFDPNRILLQELAVTGAYNYDENGFEDALALLASGELPIDRLVEPDDVPLAGMLDAMQRLASGRVSGKVLVVPR